MTEFFIPRIEKRGWIEVICGSMFSGKTEELIRRVKRALIANQNVLIFKPRLDNRYASNYVVSHNQRQIMAIEIENIGEIVALIEKSEKQPIHTIAIDEVQFFDIDIVEICNQLANKGIRIILAGLDMDFKGEPFGPVPQLLSIAEFVTKLHAVCTNCGNIASFSFRKDFMQEKIFIGGNNDYEPRCRKCYYH